MSWFERLTGVQEKSPEQVRRDLSVIDDSLVLPSGKRIACGRLEIPRLADLRAAVAEIETADDSSGPNALSIRRLKVREVVGDVRALHVDAKNAGALFQVASQFNLLEMTGPSVTPERGVGIYEHDRTQGPTCAIACGAGTIYRNYFVPVDGAIGQSASRQVNCAADLGAAFEAALGMSQPELWEVQNGYLFPTDNGLKRICDHLAQASKTQLDMLRGELRIGLQWNAAVTTSGAAHRVSQAYCSALPVAYGSQVEEAWTRFACLVLEAAYEATLAAAVVNASQTGTHRVFLTLLGGGVFGNRETWILSAIERAINLYSHHNLDVAIVSYGRSKPSVAALARRLQATNTPQTDDSASFE